MQLWKAKKWQYIATAQFYSNSNSDNTQETTGKVNVINTILFSTRQWILAYGHILEWSRAQRKLHNSRVPVEMLDHTT